jgi:hypothetical protein
VEIINTVSHVAPILSIDVPVLLHMVTDHLDSMTGTGLSNRICV